MPWDYISMTLLMLTGMFMMIVVLLQRGRGGGLAGAFGGAGGQSAFGTKAGDVFTKITVGIAVFWVILAGVSGFALQAGGQRYKSDGPERPTVQASEDHPEGESNQNNESDINSGEVGNAETKSADESKSSKNDDAGNRDDSNGKSR